MSSSTTSLWYRISFSAAMASSSGDLIRVGPKTIPRFSAFIRFSFSWRVTLENTSEGGGFCVSHVALHCALEQNQKQDVCGFRSICGFFGHSLSCRGVWNSREGTGSPWWFPQPSLLPSLLLGYLVSYRLFFQVSRERVVVTLIGDGSV